MRIKPKKTRRSAAPSVILLCVAVVAACALYVTGGLREYRDRRGNAELVAASVTRLRAMEDRPLPQLLSRQSAPPSPTPAPAAPARPTPVFPAPTPVPTQTPPPPFDEAAEREKILAMQKGDVTAAQLQRWYRDAALVGDSTAEGAKEYGWLGSVVYAKIGVRASVDSPLLDQVEARQPSVIFLTYGTNDVAVYSSQVDVFTRRYRAVIERLQKNCPDSAIYVSAVLPVSEKCASQNAYAKYIGLYNEELEALCGELGVTFLDPGFILLQRPELFDNDGIHMTYHGYPLWLTYLADEAGISSYEEA